VNSVIKQLEGNVWSMLVRGACNWKEMWRESVWEGSFHGFGDITCGIHTGVVAPQVWVLTQLYTTAPEEVLPVVW